MGEDGKPDADGSPEGSPAMGRRHWLRQAALAGSAMVGLAGSEALAEEADSVVPDTAYDVRRFGARGDGKTDDTAAAQAAIDAALKAGGGRVHFPSGSYRIRKSLVVGSGERMDVTGDGASSALLHETNEPLLLWKEGVSCRESSVRHLRITSVGQNKSPDVAAIACLGGSERSFFSHLLLNAAGAAMGSGIVVERVMDTTTLAHCLFWGPVGGTGIKVARGSEVRIFGGRVLGSADPYQGVSDRNIGVHLTGNNGGVHIVTTDLIGLHTGLRIGDVGMPSNREIFITHATFDSSVHGVVQRDNAYTSIAGCWAASSDEDQILVEPSAAGAILVVSGGTIFNGGAYGRPGKHHGIVVHAGSFILSGVTVRHNKGTGILVATDRVRDYAITGCRIADNNVGAELRGSHYTFTGNVLVRNRTALRDAGTGKQVVGNVVG